MHEWFVDPERGRRSVNWVQKAVRVHCNRSDDAMRLLFVLRKTHQGSVGSATRRSRQRPSRRTTVSPYLRLLHVEVDADISALGQALMFDAKEDVPFRVASSSSSTLMALFGIWTYRTTEPRMKQFFTAICQSDTHKSDQRFVRR